MTYSSKATMMISTFFFLSIINFLSQICASSSSKATAIFPFGDSTMDSGNNNGLVTMDRSDHPPYGMDLPDHVPTGRFTNGLLATDFLASILGLKKMLPAYLDPNVTDNDLLTGVSFGSAGSGLDNLTARNSGTLSMWTQLDNFEQASRRIERHVGEKEMMGIVNNALFIIGTGVNDMRINFYDLSFKRLSLSLSEYQDFLLNDLKAVIQVKVEELRITKFTARARVKGTIISNTLEFMMESDDVNFEVIYRWVCKDIYKLIKGFKRLYILGARKISVMGLPPIGCLPIQVTLRSLLPTEHMLQRVCVDQLNTDSQAYNTKLQTLLSELQSSLSGAKIAYADIYTPIFDMMKHPSKYGFERTLEGCCGTGMMEMGPLCNSLTQTCSDPSKFLFWDAVHPTEATYQVLAEDFQRKVFPQLDIN